LYIQKEHAAEDVTKSGDAIENNDEFNPSLPF